MGSPVVVRSARVEDVPARARSRQSLAGDLPRAYADPVLDNPGFVASRERFWTAAFTDERLAQNRVAVAERDGSVMGIAMSGHPQDADASWSAQLYVLYLLAADHGSGTGPAVLTAVIDPHESAVLWVANPNPRAQAFYRKHGFTPDGSSKIEDGVPEIRMVRTVPDALRFRQQVRCP